jgi:hypothetical protein
VLGIVIAIYIYIAIAIAFAGPLSVVLSPIVQGSYCGQMRSPSPF